MSFKKCFSTVACMSADCETVIAACKKYHIAGVEVRLGNDGSVFGMTKRADVKKIKDEFEKSGIVITDLGSSVCLMGYDEQSVKDMQPVIDKAAEIGCRGVRVFLGNFAVRVNPDKPEPDYRGIVKALAEICDDAKKKNVEIWVETHNEFATGKVLKRLLKDVNRENLKIIWDVIHPIEDGETIEETWAQIGKSIAHVHIKDGVNRHDPEWHDFQYTRLGEGELPLYELLDLLKNAGYDGYVSLEWESAWRPELQAFPQDLDYILKQYNDFLESYRRK